ncbi:MAG: ATP-binding protein [Endomicrobium sp.]|jgi:predicted AAA+ superfamily ATPase|nr:ATP-binding protein [Endomicrobium sp.]
MLKRTISDTILKISSAWPVLLLTGPRQVGKSSALKMLKEKGRKLVSLDDIPTRTLALNDPQAFLQKYSPPVLIDEIQYAPSLFSYIKIWVDEHRYEHKTKGSKAANPAGAFWLTGSQKFSLMKGVQESLAGRIAIVDLLGLSYQETIGKPKKSKPFWPYEIDMNEKVTKRTVLDVYKDIWNGSFPEFITNPAMGRDKFFSSYMQTYLERDVRDYQGTTDELKFYKFVRAVAVRTGNLINYEDLARDCDIDRRTVQKWLDTLQASGLVYLLAPYSSNLTSRITKTPKLYFLDTGLACFLANIDSPEVLEASYLNGAMLETYAICEILKSFWHNGEDARNMYFYRDSNKKEIDLILEKNMTLYPIEIKKTTSPDSNDYANFRILDHFKKTVGKGALLCLSPEIMPTPKKNVTILPVWQI